MNGLFITFEGVEGSGKTTQVELLRDALVSRGYSVHITREPGGDSVSERIRTVLLDVREAITPVAELYLFLAARAQLVEKEIRPRLDAGEVVLCDRFSDSTVAYQGYGRGLDLAHIRELDKLATGGIAPDITFLLDLDEAKGLDRQPERNRMEAEPLEFHRRVREGYIQESQRAPGRFVLLDAERGVAELHSRILFEVGELESRLLGA